MQRRWGIQKMIQRILSFPDLIGESRENFENWIALSPAMLRIAGLASRTMTDIQKQGNPTAETVGALKMLIKKLFPLLFLLL